MLSPSERRALRAVVDTLLPDGATGPGLERDVEAAFERLAPHRRAQLLRLLGLLEVPTFIFAIAGRPFRFSREPKPEREAILRCLADHALPLLRTGFTALKRLVLFLAYARAESDGSNPLWAGIGYPGPRDDVPATTWRLHIRSPRACREVADAVVVGSGAGGSVAAALLAQAGMRTIVLEAGPPADDVARTQSEANAVASLYLEAGTCATTDLGVAILAGACVGGGTTVNWSTSLRLSDAVCEQWSQAAGTPELHAELHAAYDAVEARLALVRAPAHNRNNSTISSGCERLGLRCIDIPRNASPCGTGCGYCGFGCAYGSKRSGAATFLADAVAAGASVYAGVRVERVLSAQGTTCGVEAHTPSGRLRIEAPLVVVAAGALRTPRILSCSGIGSRHLGRHLRLHPVAALAAEFEAPVEPWNGPIQTALCDEYSALRDGYGFTIECAPAHPGLAGLAIPWRSAAGHALEMRRLRNTAVLIVLARDRGEGRVSMNGRDDVSYTLGTFDAEHLQNGLVVCAQIALAAGARRVTTFHTDPVVLEAPMCTAALARFEATVRARGVGKNRMPLFSAHQMGTARIGSRPSDSVLNEYGAVHGLRGALVTDASAFPLASGVNPMLTIMALAHRATTQYLRASATVRA